MQETVVAWEEPSHVALDKQIDDWQSPGRDITSHLLCTHVELRPVLSLCMQSAGKTVQQLPYNNML